MDVVFAGAGLALSLPVLAGLGLAIWCEDGWPVLFRHTRIGRNGVPFELLKLRTMRRSNWGSQITAAGDKRITRVGQILRRYKLDELPQLWNVIRGDMSLVGPRPESPNYVDANDPVWREVLLARPGITGLASLMYHDEERILAQSADPERYYRAEILPAKLALTLAYAKTRSLLGDLKLIVLTIRCSFLPSRFDESAISRHFLRHENI